MFGGDHSVTGLVPIVVAEVDSLRPYLDGWDRLAVESGRPFCAPAWMLAWWRNGRTGHTELRIVIVVDGDGELVGVGPFFAQIGPMRLAEYRLLAAGFSHRIGPLAAPGRQEEVAAVMARALADADPPPASVVFEGVDAADRWPELVAAHWPRGRTQLRTDLTMDAPIIDLAGDYEAWMSRRDRRFRKEARRTKRRLDELEVTSRENPDQAAVDALLSLHEARWKDRGGSNLGVGARAVIADAADDFGEDSGRLGILLLEAPRGPIAAELVLRAGPTMAFWAGGFDPSWSTLAPGTQAMLAALDGASPEVTVADLGGGAHEYKRRMADSSAPLVWRTVFPLGRRYPLIRLRLAPKHIRAGARSWFRRLPPSTQSRVRRLMGERT